MHALEPEMRNNFSMRSAADGFSGATALPQWASMGLDGPRCRKSTHPASAPPPPSGRGHQTSFAQVAADLLGAAGERVYIVIGDANVVKTGGEGGTVFSLPPLPSEVGGGGGDTQNFGTKLTTIFKFLPKMT